MSTDIYYFVIKKGTDVKYIYMYDSSNDPALSKTSLTAVDDDWGDPMEFDDTDVQNDLGTDMSVYKVARS